MDTTTIPQRVTGRAALTRIMAAIDAGAPVPDTIRPGVDAGGSVSYHHTYHADPAGMAIAMVRALGISGEARVRQCAGYHEVVWGDWRSLEVEAYVAGEAPRDGYRSSSPGDTPGELVPGEDDITDEPQATPERPLITDPVALAAAYGLAVGPEWLRPEEHPDGTYGQPPAQSTVDTVTPLDLTAIDQALAEAQETP